MRLIIYDNTNQCKEKYIHNVNSNKSLQTISINTTQYALMKIEKHQQNPETETNNETYKLQLKI